MMDKYQWRRAVLFLRIFSDSFQFSGLSFTHFFIDFAIDFILLPIIVGIYNQIEVSNAPERQRNAEIVSKSRMDSFTD
ncbi:MAG: hypothetical protein KA369_05465 [Spirochaetes bacterium]|nr:hypothetical protein [Spirochaetota bacterium]